MGTPRDFLPHHCGALSLILAVGIPLHSLAGWLDTAAGVTILFLLGVSLFGWVCYIQLLADLARAFGDRRLARAFGGYLVSSICFLFLAVVGGCAMLAAVADLPALEGPPIRALLCGVWMAFSAALAGWLLVLLTRLHRLIPVPGEPDQWPDFPRRDRLD